MLLSEGQMSDYRRAAPMLPTLPKAKELLADKGYDADWFRATLAERGVTACTVSKSSRKVTIPSDAVLYKQRYKIETCSGGSRIGVASTPDTTVAPTPTSQKSASLQSSSFGCNQ